MAIDLVSLALISLVSVACPIIAGLIPGKPIPETVLLLLAGALLGPHGSAPFSLLTPSTCCPIWVSPFCSFSPATRYRRRTSPVRRGSVELLPGRSPSPSRSSSWPFGRRCRPSSWTARRGYRAHHHGHGHASAHSAGARHPGHAGGERDHRLRHLGRAASHHRHGASALDPGHLADGGHPPRVPRHRRDGRRRAEDR